MTVMNPDLFERTGDADFSPYIKALIAGDPKSGKTNLLGTVPGIFICDTEPDANNMETVRHLDLPVATIRKTQDLKDVAITLGNDTLRKQLAQQRYGMDDITAVGIDTMDTLQKIMKRERMVSERSRTFERDDWGWLKTEMEQVIQTFTALPMHVFFTVHLKTSELGSGQDRWSKVEPGLEGAIAATIAGMVGYSLLTFREEDFDEVTKQITTKYFVRTEGNKTHGFLGTRIPNQALPPIIAPDMGQIHGVIQAGRQAVLDARAARAALPAPEPMYYPGSGQVVQGQVLPQEPVQSQQAPPLPPPPAQPQQQAQPLPVDPHAATQQMSGHPDAQPNPVQASEVPAQTVSQEPVVQTPVPTPGQPAEEVKPSDGDPINMTALTHLKRIYDACQIAMPEDLLKTKTMGEARQVSSGWRAILKDHEEGKAAPGTTAASDMLGLLAAMGFVEDQAQGQAPAPAAPAAPAVMETLDIGATLPAIKGYIGDPPNLERVQEVYDAETAKGDKARSSLVKQMLTMGAKPVEATPEPTANPAEENWEYPAPEGQAPPVQTPVATPEQPVTPPATQTDTSVTGEGPSDPALAALQDGLGAQVVSTAINENSKCEVCGNPVDDVDLAELGVKRFGKLFCVTHYVAHTKQ